MGPFQTSTSTGGGRFHQRVAFEACRCQRTRPATLFCSSLAEGFVVNPSSQPALCRSSQIVMGGSWWCWAAVVLLDLSVVALAHLFDDRVAAFAIQNGVADTRQVVLDLGPDRQAYCSFSFAADRQPRRIQQQVREAI